MIYLVLGGVLLALIGYIVFLSREAAKAEQEGKTLKDIIDVKDKQAQAAANAPRTKSQLLDWLRKQ